MLAPVDFHPAGTVIDPQPSRQAVEDGGGHNAHVTTAAPTISARIHSLNRPNLVSIGTIVWLSSELMFFAGLFAIYFTIRAQNVGEWPPPPTHLDIPYALVEEGTTIPGSAYGTVFYMLTGFHGLHVTGGLIAFIYLLIRTKLSKFTPQQATAAIVVSYYWHFVGVVWVGLFA